MDQIGSNLSKLDQTWLNLIELNQTWSNLLKLDEIESKLIKLNHDKERFRGGMVKTLALYSKGQRFEPQRRRFFTPTQWNPSPPLTPPTCWVRHVHSIGGPQYGSAVCCVVQHATKVPWLLAQKGFDDQWWQTITPTSSLQNFLH